MGLINWLVNYTARYRLRKDERQPSRGTWRRLLQLETLEARCLLAGDIILDWNDVMLQANANDHARSAPEQGGPILTGRAFAIVSVAMYDAYNSIEGIGEAYLTTAATSDKANSDAAVAQAAHDTLVALFPSQKALFDKELFQTLKAIPNGSAENRGRAVGAYVAKQILVARANDGASSVNDGSYTSSGLPGFHDVDPLNPNQGFYAPGAMDIDPFAITSVDAFPARQLDDGTAAGRLAFLQSEEYTTAYNELLAYGSDGISAPTQRTDEQTTIGIYWGYDGRPGLGTPPRLYNQIVREIAVQEGNTEAENARLFALVNISMADAGVAAWNTKYDDAFWRPVLGVRGGDVDGNPDTVADSDWTPLGAPASNPRAGEIDFTPPFPAYTSGHATFGAAAFEILENFYGRDDISFSFVSDEFNDVTLGSDGQVRSVVERTFDSFTEAKIENAQSRIYLGIHWRFDADEGIRQGDAVADYVFANILASDDRFEDNDTLSTASHLGAPTATQTLNDLALLDKNDWYRISLASRGGTNDSVTIQFDNAAGNLDLLLYEARGHLLRSSTGTASSERVSLRGLERGNYYVRVVGHQGATNADYSLTLNLNPALVDDSYEQNDSFSTAHNLGTLTTATNVTGLVMADANDWYRFTTTGTGGRVNSVAIRFQHSQGKLGLELYNAQGQRVRLSHDFSGGEKLSLSRLTADTYYVRVFGIHDATNPSYSLQLNPPVADDQFFPDTSFV